MNHFFGLAGFLAAGMASLWISFVIAAPWLHLYGAGRSSGPLWVWLLWGATSILGVGAAFAFLRCSLKAHWAALLRNAPLSPSAWRGVCGIYLVVMIAFAFPVLSGDPSGTHTTEKYLYAFLAVCSFTLGVTAIRKGMPGHGHPVEFDSSGSF